MIDTTGLSAPFQAAVADLRAAESPRTNSWDSEHVRRLAGVDHQDLPPIVVHRDTRRVIDGMHRLAAARMRGADTISAVFFDGTEADAFVLGVRLNARHGLPLSRQERCAAAAKIIASHPRWSDRMIAESVGLSDKAVAAIRRADDGPSPETRIGKDGRVRPVTSARRERVRQLLADDPGASLRSIARQAGVAVETVRRIRIRVHADGGQDEERHRQRVVSMTPAEALQILKNDPALRLSATNRALLRLFDARFGDGDVWQDMFANVPNHCAGMIADLARQYSAAWLAAAEQLTKRGAPGEHQAKPRSA